MNQEYEAFTKTFKKHDTSGEDSLGAPLATSTPAT